MMGDKAKFLDPMTYIANRSMREIAVNTGVYTPASEKKTNANEAAVEAQAKEAKETAALDASEEARKKRNAMFQTEGGSAGESTLNVGARDTYFGN